MIRVGLVGASLAVRAGLHMLVAERRRIEVVGEAASLAEAGQLRCDVLVVAEAPPFAGFGGLGGPGPQLAASGPDPPPAVLLIAQGAADLGSLPELPLRAWGLLSPEATGAEMRAAVAALAEGLVVASPPLLQGHLRRPAAGPAGPDGQAARLTPREIDVLRLLAEGLANKQVGAELGISDHTVKFHVASIYGKLGASNRIEAVQAGLRQGILSL